MLQPMYIYRIIQVFYGFKMFCGVFLRLNDLLNSLGAIYVCDPVRGQGQIDKSRNLPRQRKYMQI